MPAAYSFDGGRIFKLISTGAGRARARSSRRAMRRTNAKSFPAFLKVSLLERPISVMVWNKDARPEAYREMESAFRPSHADYTYQAKYGIRNWQGGGRASARETIGRVAAAAIAKRVLHQIFS